MFQSQVRDFIGSGIPGEFAYTGPRRVKPGFIAAAATAVNCVIGRFYTKNVTTGELSPGGTLVDGTTIFGGILGFPKEHASFGTLGDPFAATLTLPPGAKGDFIEMGEPFVFVNNVCKRGDLLAYEVATGKLYAYTNGTAPPAGQALIPNAQVSGMNYNSAVGGSVVIVTLTN
jgi:hypothetical protein